MSKRRKINRLENDRTVIERVVEPVVTEEPKVEKKVEKPAPAEVSVSVKRKRVIPGSVKLLKKRTNRFF